MNRRGDDIELEEYLYALFRCGICEACGEAIAVCRCKPREPQPDTAGQDDAAKT